MAEDRVIRQRSRRTPTRAGVVLSPDVIVETAMRLISEHGGEALSVRRLGAAIGASPTAIYRYFATMDDVLLELADRLIAVSIEGFEPTADWRADLRDLAHRAHRVYLEHPRVALLVAARTTGRPHEARVVELILGILRSAGFDDAEAVRHYRTLGDLILAFSAVDAGFAALPQSTRDADRARWAANHATADPATHPHMTALAPLLVANADIDAFGAAVELILIALETQAADRGASGAS